jgi:Adenylate kinase and related kinases
MRIVFFGPNGSGKGTQATLLKDELKVPHISTGDLLRAAVKAGTPLGIKAKAVMEAGHLVSDEIVLGMLEERLAQPDVGNGFILDGYPRNLAQCAALETLLDRLGQPLDVAIKLDVPDSAILSRCEIRFAAEHRKDDDPEIVRKRLDVYRAQTEPVAEHFAQSASSRPSTVSATSTRCSNAFSRRFHAERGICIGRPALPAVEVRLRRSS